MTNVHLLTARPAQPKRPQRRTYVHGTNITLEILQLQSDDLHSVLFQLGFGESEPLCGLEDDIEQQSISNAHVFRWR